MDLLWKPARALQIRVYYGSQLGRDKSGSTMEASSDKKSWRGARPLHVLIDRYKIDMLIWARGNNSKKIHDQICRLVGV